MILGAFHGPYSNLTTLTASVLALHPHVQVLNHGGRRLLARPELNFVADPHRATAERFAEVALAESRGGARGMHGGSILLSHAFDAPVLRATYRARFGTALMRRRVHALVWKDSLVLSRAIRRSGVDPRRLFDACPDLRLVVPVRYPLDCAVSCVLNGHAPLLSRDGTVVGVLDGVLRELAWARALERAWPERVFVFWEDELGEAVLRGLARHLELELDPRWLEDATRCFVATRTYQHPPALVARYTAAVRDVFRHDRDFAARLLELVAIPGNCAIPATPGRHVLSVLRDSPPRPRRARRRGRGRR